jgi:hypothetical protein
MSPRPPLHSALRSVVVQGLRSHREEIVDAVHSHLDTVSGRTGRTADAHDAAGLRTAVTAAVDYGLSTPKSSGEAWPAPTPPVLLRQVRRAAIGGISFGTVLRCLILGHGSLVERIMEEACRRESDTRLLRGVRTSQETLLERLTDAAANEHQRSLAVVAESPERTRAILEREVLSVLDYGDLRGYQFDHAWHLGMIATRIEGKASLVELGASLGAEHIFVPRGCGIAWIWIGSNERDALPDAARLSAGLPAGVVLAVGEPRQGRDGCLATHGDARVALPVALHRGVGVTLCAESLLEAALLKDPHLLSLLREIHLSPLNGLLRGNASAVHETLSAYFASGHNVKVTAARLCVDRRTVWYRLNQVAGRLGRTPDLCRAELEIALRIAEGDDRPSRHPA